MKSILPYVLCVWVSVFLTFPSMGQENTYYQLAEQYYQQGKYEEAVSYYQRIYKNTQNPAILKKYVACLIALNNVEQAVKLQKKAIKKSPNNVDLQIQLGLTYWQAKNQEEARFWWDNAIQTLQKNHDQIIQTAHTFAKVNQNTYAIAAYELGKKHIKGFYSYYPQMADIYGLLEQYEEMIDLYLELININKGYLPLVQNSLNRNFDFETPNTPTEILKQQLLSNIQKHPETTSYAEMYIWVCMKQENYQAAYRQVAALDRRLNENGARLITFARSAKNKGAYGPSLKAYESIIAKGTNSPFYAQAKLAVLDVKYLELADNPSPTPEALSALIALHKSTIAYFGWNNATAPAIRQEAKLYAFFLHDYAPADSLLTAAIASGTLDQEQKALTTIDLGDYKLYQNHVFQAHILYLRAENAFKYDDIGDIAKLKSAKVAYYTGKFSFAKGKLDVLKRSTSKLIANDALVLSNLITDNTTIDTNLRPMELYATADLMLLQRRFNEGMTRLDSLQEYFPDHMLADEVLMLKSRYYLAQNQYELAAESLQEIYDMHADDILADDALMQLGYIYTHYLNNPSRAMEYYFKLMTEYESSFFVPEARKNYRKLRGDNV